MRNTPKGFRLHIGIFGRRNVGKSSLLNAMTRQNVSIVSDVAGTTTDPVEKPMELLPIGPVLFIDTAGIDDAGALGEMRVARTRQVFDRTDVGIVVVGATDGKNKGGRLLKLSERSCRSGSSNQSPSTGIIVYSTQEVKPKSVENATEAAKVVWGEFEEGILRELRAREIPIVVVFNKADIAKPGTDLTAGLTSQKVPFVFTVAADGSDNPKSEILNPKFSGILDLREALIRTAPEEFINAPAIIGDLVGGGELVVLVVPIDLEAPKGRLMLPQVQAIRDVLDVDSYCMVVKERELRDALDRLKRPPALVVTDSQGFLKVAGDTPPEIPLTSFSILFARYKGDLCEFVRGACAIDSLRPGDRVLIAEACSHHPIGEDIGRVKIPRWLTQYVGGKMEFTSVQGHDFPDDLSPYKLIVHCGGCMWNRREMLSRMLRCRQAGVPIANYGLTIAYTLGIFERALSPFPAALETYRQLRAGR